MNEKYVQFLLHDPIGNLESQVTNFDKEAIESAAAVGMIFIGVKSDGSRAIVPPDEVKEPRLTAMGGFPIVLPSYVDSKIDEVMGVVQQLLLAVSNTIPNEEVATVQKSITTLRAQAEMAIASEKELLSGIEPIANVMTGMEHK